MALECCISLSPNDGEVKEKDAGMVFKLLIEIGINQIEHNFGYI